MTVQRFEDLEVWKNARLLYIKIRDLSISSSLAKDYSLKDQILRSSGSVMDNIAEGFERDGKKEFIQFLLSQKEVLVKPVRKFTDAWMQSIFRKNCLLKCKMSAFTFR